MPVTPRHGVGAQRTRPSANELDRTHRAELSDSHFRQAGHLQSRGTGALCVQRNRGERSSRELENILRVGVNENTKAHRFSIWLSSEYSTSQVKGYSLYHGGLD